MILTDKSHPKNEYLSIKRYLLWGLSLIIGIVVITNFFLPLVPNFDTQGKFHLQCDAEQSINGTFFSDGYKFKGGHTQNDSLARSGTHSSKIDKQSPYGLGYDLHQIQKGDRYKVRVWRYSPRNQTGYLVVSAKNSKNFYVQEELSISKESSGWELVEILFNVPKDKDLDLLKIYTYSSIKDNKSVFFDDLSIERITDLVQASDTSNTPLTPHFDLKIEEKYMTKLQEKRKAAFNNGILITEDDDWVNAYIGGKEKDTPIKLRLKGDWLDHLEGDRWSFRIKAKAPYSWNRLITFSIQSPHTRSFLREWFFHKFLERVDVLTPRYGFIRVSLNGKDLGVYAYEEHFDKQLPEFKQRREGPIVKLTEDAMWASHKKQHDLLGGISFADYSQNAYLASEIRPFKEKKTLANPTLAKQFDIAKNLMHQYKYDLQSASEIFDIDRLTKYYAIMDICQAYHGFTWHNQRFYYNPVTSKLEPIGFDGYGDHLVKFSGGPFIGYYHKPDGYISDTYRNLLEDRNFYSKYIQYLYQFSKQEYLQNLLLDLESDLLQLEVFLQEEYPDYQFEKEAIRERARKLNALVFPIPEIALKAYRQSQTGNQLALKVNNHHCLPLQIVGFGKNEQDILEKPTSPITIYSQARNELPKYVDVEAPVNTKVIFYTLLGMDSLFHTKVKQWEIPDNQTPAQSLEVAMLKPNEAFEVIDKKIVFKTGEHLIQKSLAIPSGFQVHFEAGTRLNFTDKAKFISYSPIYMYGTAENPVYIHSDDQTANGFTVLQASEKSELHHVVFDHFNTLQQEGWTLTGAVTFYESEVLFDHCSFINNHCEDAINIIRSKFEMNDCLVQNTFADGFDCDFCKGKVARSRFVNTGNDAMDFSGSVITISNCTVEKAGDKGISAGEEATILVEATSINGAQIGLASKDFSKLKANNIELSNCYHGFAAYQKKPEYGSATIEVKEYTSNDVKHLYLIESGSLLKLNGKAIKGE